MVVSCWLVTCSAPMALWPSSGTWRESSKSTTAQLLEHLVTLLTFSTSRLSLSRKCKIHNFSQFCNLFLSIILNVYAELMKNVLMMASLSNRKLSTLGSHESCTTGGTSLIPCGTLLLWPVLKKMERLSSVLLTRLVRLTVTPRLLLATDLILPFH